MFVAYRAGKEHRRTRARVSVGESARGAAFETPARARGRRQPTGKPTFIGVGGAREANEISARSGAAVACLERARHAHHQMRDITVAGDVDLAQLENEQSVFVRLHTQRRVHLRTAGTRDSREDSTPSELLTDDLGDRRVGGLRKSYLGARLPSRDSRVALPRRIENAHLFGDDARVDRDLARERPMLRALASNPAGGECSRLATEQVRGTAGECEEREMSKEVAHLISRRGRCACVAARRRLGNDEARTGGVTVAAAWGDVYIVADALADLLTNHGLGACRVHGP